MFKLACDNKLNNQNIVSKGPRLTPDSFSLTNSAISRSFSRDDYKKGYFLIDKDRTTNLNMWCSFIIP